jgi:hypothetical protein
MVGRRRNMNPRLLLILPPIMMLNQTHAFQSVNCLHHVLLIQVMCGWHSWLDLVRIVQGDLMDWRLLNRTVVLIEMIREWSISGWSKADAWIECHQIIIEFRRERLRLIHQRSRVSFWRLRGTEIFIVQVQRFLPLNDGRWRWVKVRKLKI